ncbi:HIT family protein [Mobilicoccus massiliensis]|uniref:HIT family protein n=1 Tax=Mobilicoccus massiliensis TaxID=1522310 RepID=UPI00058E7638|nr:HIT family protein [Mobilicoccus massiliensis]
MTTIFTRIIDGEIPGRFVWSDDRCVAFLSAGPITPGHTLVVPRAEVDAWTDAEPDLFAHLATVAQTIGRAQLATFACARTVVAIQGFEVNHLHVHVWPADSPADFDFGKAQQDPDPAMMDDAAARLRAALREDPAAAGHVPDEDA